MGVSRLRKGFVTLFPLRKFGFIASFLRITQSISSFDVVGCSLYVLFYTIAAFLLCLSSLVHA